MTAIQPLQASEDNPTEKKSAPNWSYGCGKPDDWGDDVEDQLRKQNHLWNRLVELDQAHRVQYFSITADDPDVAALEAQIAQLEKLLAEAVEARNKARKLARRKSGSDVEVHDAAVKALSIQLKPLREKAKDARKAARARLTPALKDLEEKRKAAVTEARQQAAADGLWWGNYNAVLASYDMARQRAVKTGAELRFRRYDGEGRLTVQIQGGMTPDQLLSGDRSEVRVVRQRPAPNGKPSRWSTLVITAFARGREMRRTVSIPVMIHRAFPSGAVIKAVALIRHRLAPGKFEFRVVFQVVFPKQDAQPVGRGVAGVDFGWRQLNSGLRIAVLADDSGLIEKVVMPGDIVRRLELVGEIQSDIDLEVDEHWRSLLATDWSAAPVEMADELKAMKAARRPHPRHMARLVKVWPENWEFERRTALAEFLKRDWKERLRLARTRGSALRARQDWQRKTVAGWLRRYHRIVVDGVDMRSGLRIERQDGTPTPLNTAARHNARIAAVGELRAWIIDAGTRAGVEVVQHKGKSTWTCHICGTPHKPENAANIFHRCGSCGTLWDQDENAARNLLLVGAGTDTVAAD